MGTSRVDDGHAKGIDMTDEGLQGARQAWNEVGERFSTWGRHLAERYQASAGPAGERAREAQRTLEESARELADQLNRAFTALGSTLRDPDATHELGDAVRALGDAVSTTVAEAGEEIRRRFGPSDPGVPPAPEPPEPPTSDPA
jgi:hypothetical protein